MFSNKMNVGSFCFIFLTLLCHFNVVVQSDDAPTCSNQSTLIPYGGLCSNSSQCVTGYCDVICMCPANTYYHSCTASCALNCNTTATSSFGQIVSPGYPYQYPNNALCTWNLIEVQNSYYVISITYMDIEFSDNCSYDSLKIYDVTSVGNTQLAMFCNRNDSTTKIVASSSNSTQLVFKTDGSVTVRGFIAYYKRFAYNATITEPLHGYIASPGYPLEYPANSYFTWTIIGRPESFISLRLLRVTIEGSCIDPISIYDGNNTNTRLLAKFCSNNYSQPIFTSTGNYLHVVFRTDHSVEYSGLLATYGISECEAILTNPVGDIVSPGYPLGYVANLSCSWTVVTNPNKIIFLRINEVYLNDNNNCTFDHLKIYDGRDIQSPLVGTFCYTTATIVSTSNVLYLVLETGESRNYKGFMATYSSADFPVETMCNSSTPCVQSPSCIYDRCVCPDNYYHSRPSNTCSEALGETRICEPQVANMCSRKTYLVCQPDKNGVTRCLCPSGSFNNGTCCLPYSYLNFFLTRSPDILTTSVTFHLTTGATTQPVSYQVAWVATDNSSNFGAVVESPSGLLVQGLTPGTEYNFTVLAIIQGLGYYNDTTLSKNLTFETLPARPGELNESSSNLLNSPYVLRFGPSEGRVARYVITVGARSYDVLTPELTLQDLTPDTRYNYTIIAYNKGGHGSDDVKGSFKIESVKQEEEAARESLNIGLIAGVTVASVIFVFGVTVGVTLVVKKRRNGKQMSASKVIIDEVNQDNVGGSSPTAPTRSANTLMNTYMTMNVAALLSNISKDQTDDSEYDYVVESPIDVCQDETYENVKGLTTDVIQDGTVADNVYQNCAYVPSKQR